MKNTSVLNYDASYDAMTNKEKRMMVEKAIEEERYPYLHTYFTGIRFNIPECCRLFFLKGLLYFQRDDDFIPYLQQSEFNKNYIMCPECLVKEICSIKEKKIEMIAL